MPKTSLKVSIQPGSKKNEIIGFHDEYLKIKIKAAPIEGKANEELISFLAKFLKLHKTDIKIIHGENSKKKLLEISLEKEELSSRLRQAFS